MYYPNGANMSTRQLKQRRQQSDEEINLKNQLSLNQTKSELKNLEIKLEYISRDLENSEKSKREFESQLQEYKIKYENEILKGMHKQNEIDGLKIKLASAQERVEKFDQNKIQYEQMQQDVLMYKQKLIEVDADIKINNAYQSKELMAQHIQIQSISQENMMLKEHNQQLQKKNQHLEFQLNQQKDYDQYNTQQNQ